MKIAVAIEIGRTRVFASALDWPGWSRSAKTEDAALDALVEYWPRYARVVKGMELAAPSNVSSLDVIDRLKGNSTTDFGAPGAMSKIETASIAKSELDRLSECLERCWKSFDSAVRKAEGRSLRKGPRGGGRDLVKMISHVLEAERSYLSGLGGKAPAGHDFKLLRTAIRESLQASARGELPAVGPRGGVRWPAPYFIRRTAWHVLDHAWELEDRIE